MVAGAHHDAVSHTGDAILCAFIRSRAFSLPRTKSLSSPPLLRAAPVPLAKDGAFNIDGEYLSG